MTVKRAYSTTEVPVSKTMDEIRKQLLKYGVEEVQVSERVATLEHGGLIRIGFITPDKGFEVRMQVEIPCVDAYATVRQQEQHGKAEARALFHVVKNKLAGTEYGIETVEIAFLPYLVTDGGATIAERPELIERFQGGRSIVTPAPVIALPERTG